MTYDKEKRHERYMKNKERDNARRREYYKEHKEQENAKGREWYYTHKAELRPKRRLAEKRYKQSEKGIKSRRENCQRPEVRAKNRARMLVYTAIQKGDLVRQACEKCGSTTQIEAHHEDYAQPLDVVWLCRKCHLALHRKENERK